MDRRPSLPLLELTRRLVEGFASHPPQRTRKGGAPPWLARAKGWASPRHNVGRLRTLFLVNQSRWVSGICPRNAAIQFNFDFDYLVQACAVSSQNYRRVVCFRTEIRGRPRFPPASLSSGVWHAFRRMKSTEVARLWRGVATSHPGPTAFVALIRIDPAGG